MDEILFLKTDLVPFTVERANVRPRVGISTRCSGYFTVAKFDVKKSWEEKAVNVRGLGLDSGHLIPEELPEEFAAACLGFLDG